MFMSHNCEPTDVPNVRCVTELNSSLMLLPNKLINNDYICHFMI